MPTREQIHATIGEYVAAVGRQDVEATVALFAEDARQEDPAGTPPNVGHGAIRAFFEKSFSTSFSTDLTGPVLVTGDHAAFHFTITVPLGEETLTVRVIDMVRFDESGRIAELRAVLE